MGARRRRREANMGVTPAVGICPVCDSAFDYVPRKQGGGKRRIYCSTRCRANDWARGNAGKRKASVIAYDSKPESKMQKRLRTRDQTLKRYGWTEADFQRQLHRQNHQCNGCLCAIGRDSARVDHDHETGRVRGLLCDSCNWALGHVKDNPVALRRLMAHLDYKQHKVNVYLIGALKNPRVPVIG